MDDVSVCATLGTGTKSLTTYVTHHRLRMQFAYLRTV